MSSRRPTIYLFDIDGTILSTGGAGRRAFERAFFEVTGRDDACAGFSFGGMTDLAIVRKALEAVGHAMESQLVETFFDVYLEILRDEVARSERYTVMPAIRETVAHLRSLPNTTVGLGTGNVRRGAEVKLARGDLWRLFQFGGFGCDAEDRIELLRTGAERGAAALGVPRAECRVVVIGDTPKDVAAAQGIDAECIAVTTGGVSRDTLVAAGAHAVFRDLAEEGALDALLHAP